MKKLSLLLLLGPTAAFAQTLSTLAPNNGSGGIFFDLTAASNPLSFTGFATYLGSTTVGTNASIEVWTRSGTFVGNTTTNAGWTLVETVTGVAAGTATLTSAINFTNPFSLAAGSTTGFYLHSVTASNGIRYQGTGTTSTSTFSNSDLTLFSNVARTGSTSFGGTAFTPRAFSGDIYYTVNSVPEPATMAVLGLGMAVLIRRRKRTF